MPRSPHGDAAAEALERLGVRRLAFGIHQSAFPAGQADVGHGSPASAAGLRLMHWVRGLGFNAIQLGPEGQISDVNPSPYDSTAFCRNVLTLDVLGLAGPRAHELLDEDDVDAVLRTSAAGARGNVLRAEPPRARRAVADAIARAHAKLMGEQDRQMASPLLDELAGFRAREAAWLEVDAVFEVMARRIGHDDPTRFEPAVRALLAPTPDGAERRRAMRAVIRPALEQVELVQLLVHRQATLFREQANREKMVVFGDLPIGWSHRDRFLHADAFSKRWLLGAPPSRTNPEGQPWAYPLLDPDQLDDAESPARRLFARRVHHVLGYHDGVRVDHPHGLVCPWIYTADSPRSVRAVQEGTRAFSSPDMDDPDLVRWALVRREELDPRAASRWSDDWVQSLGEAQVTRFARLFDELVGIARAHGRGIEDVAAEVLSTCPLPLARVLARYGLGRFRVTQKANVQDPSDVYRTDRAEPHDWVMLGNHDTPPIFSVAAGWLSDGSAQQRAHYLAERLVRDPALRRVEAARFASSAGALAQAHLADLFVSDAENVLVYFTDLLGETEPFNRPGLVHPDNWTLRVPPDFEAVYEHRRSRGHALDLRAALRLALGAQGASQDLIDALDEPGHQKP